MGFAREDVESERIAMLTSGMRRRKGSKQAIVPS
jgi:hypothetical protein